MGLLKGLTEKKHDKGRTQGELEFSSKLNSRALFRFPASPHSRDGQIPYSPNLVHNDMDIVMILVDFSSLYSPDFGSTLHDGGLQKKHTEDCKVPHLLS